MRKRKILPEAFPYIAPMFLWICLFVLIPLCLIIFISFQKGGPRGYIAYVLTLDNYSVILQSGYLRILSRSFLYALVTNLICILVGYPLAYWIVKHGGKWKLFLLFFIIIPCWTSLLIRLYALKTICGQTGLINSVLMSIGLISSPLKIIYNSFAVMLGLVYAYLPYMVLPIYASLDGLDPSVLEASADLGATPIQRFLTITLPLTKGGILAGTILVFIPALGEWLVPLILGGAKVLMAGSLVEHLFSSTGNYPAGSSVATSLAAAVLLIIYLAMRLGGEETLERIV